MAGGKTSFDDWPLFTSSFGWTSRSSPRLPPAISLARLASTSFMFMFVCVPEPVCQTTSGNSPSCLPAITSSAASMIALPFFGSRTRRSMFTCAAARFTCASAVISAGGIFSLLIRKFCSERCVCAPQSLWAGTSIGPKVSFSMRLAMRRLLSEGARCIAPLQPADKLAGNLLTGPATHVRSGNAEAVRFGPGGAGGYGNLRRARGTRRGVVRFGTSRKASVAGDAPDTRTGVERAADRGLGDRPRLSRATARNAHLRGRALWRHHPLGARAVAGRARTVDCSGCRPCARLVVGVRVPLGPDPGYGVHRAAAPHARRPAARTGRGVRARPARGALWRARPVRFRAGPVRSPRTDAPRQALPLRRGRRLSFGLYTCWDAFYAPPPWLKRSNTSFPCRGAAG